MGWEGCTIRRRRQLLALAYLRRCIITIIFLIWAKKPKHCTWRRVEGVRRAW